MNARRIFVSLVTATACQCVVAQDSAPISAERPGFSSSPFVLSPSTMQIESGYQYTRDSGTVDIDDHTLPLALVRIGLVEKLELQLSWPGISWQEVNGQDTHGEYNVNIGVKWQVNDESATVPLALFAGLSLPTGDDRFGGDGVDPTVGAFWSLDYGMNWFGTVLVQRANDDLTLGNALGVGLPVNATTSAYVEYFGTYGGDAGPQHFLNGGIAYLPRFDLQLDLHVGAGLNGRAADAFLGFGIAYRF